MLLISSSSLRWWVFGSRSTPAEAKEIESTPPPKITSPLLSRSFFVGERERLFSGERRGGGDNKWVEKRDEVIADQRIVWICGQGGEEGKGQRGSLGNGWLCVL